MSLQLIMGGSGSGKSYRLYQEIIRLSQEDPRRNYLVIVPEQFTMQAQKELARLHPRKVLVNIDVLSFNRLAYRVFNEVGVGTKDVLEETGKSLILRKIASSLAPELKFFQNNLNKTGYINEIKSIISELAQYNISCRRLEEIIAGNQDNAALCSKLEDILLIYRKFQDYLANRYVTGEQVLELLCNVIGQSARIRDSVLALDGFTGFTPLQNQLLEELMRHARKIFVTITLDGQENPYQISGNHQLFYLSKKTVQKLVDIARRAGAITEGDIRLGQGGSARFPQGSPLAFLEQNLFREHPGAYSQEQESISLEVCRDPKAELEFVCREILRLAREEGYRYRDMGVVAGDLASYGPYVEKVFGSYGIPCFLDYKKSLLQNPLVAFINSVLEVASSNFSYTSVFRYLKTGFANMEQEKIDRLENYCIAMGIRGKSAWNREWHRTYGKMEGEELAALNETRAQVAARFEDVFGTLKSNSTTVLEKTLALYECIRSHDIQQQLKSCEEQFRRQGEVALEKEYAQVYRIAMELLEKLVGFLGEERVTLKEYQEMIQAGFYEARVGAVPLGQDSVMVGDLERSRMEHIRALFLVGANDGMIPRREAGGGILSQGDRELLAAQEVELAPTARENMFIQRFYLYLNLTKPKDRLYLSCSLQDQKQNAIRPSYLVNTVKKLFPGIRQEEEDDRSPLEYISSLSGSLEYLARGFESYRAGEGGDVWLALLGWFGHQPELALAREHLMEGAFYKNPHFPLEGDTAHQLYGQTLENSVTRLEHYAACAFAHFAQYGLQLRERREYSFEGVDMGNVFHDALEQFSKALESNGYSWFDTPVPQQETLVADAVRDAALSMATEILFDNARNEHMLHRMERILNRTVWALGEQLKKGEFVPADYERPFSAKDGLRSSSIFLTEKEAVHLRGRIDRIDVYGEEERALVRVVDYKSGQAGFDLQKVYYGLSLQLLVYLNTALELTERRLGKEAVPAGVFYYHIQDPMTDRQPDDTKEEIDERLLKQLKMSGVANSDGDIIDKMDAGLQGPSDVLPLGRNKDGSLSKASSVLSTEQFAQLSLFTTEKIKEISREILEGRIAPAPYELEGRTGCDYCAYRNVCGFDVKVPGFAYRRLRPLGREEAFEKICGALEGEENSQNQGEEDENGNKVDAATAAGD